MSRAEVRRLQAKLEALVAACKRIRDERPSIAGAINRALTEAVAAGDLSWTGIDDETVPTIAVLLLDDGKAVEVAVTSWDHDPFAGNEDTEIRGFALGHRDQSEGEQALVAEWNRQGAAHG